MFNGVIFYIFFYVFRLQCYFRIFKPGSHYLGPKFDLSLIFFALVSLLRQICTCRNQTPPSFTKVIYQAYYSCVFQRAGGEGGNPRCIRSQFPLYVLCFLVLYPRPFSTEAVFYTLTYKQNCVYLLGRIRIICLFYLFCVEYACHFLQI